MLVIVTSYHFLLIALSKARQGSHAFAPIVGSIVRNPQLKTHYLFLRIIATVAQSYKSMTVADVAKALDMPADVIAHCVGLHLYLERKRAGQLTIPPPPDYWAPASSHILTRELLEPPRAGRGSAGEAATRSGARGERGRAR